jgi:hypothetical protein
MPRCIIDVFDQTKRRERKCLHKRRWGNICSFHARKYIVKIQAAWRAYSTKKRVNLFKTLPEDTWKHILYFIHLRNNTVKLLESHEQIYNKRILFMQTNYRRLIYVHPYYLFNKTLYDSIDNRDYIRKILKTY